MAQIGTRSGSGGPASFSVNITLILDRGRSDVSACSMRVIHIYILRICVTNSTCARFSVSCVSPFLSPAVCTSLAPVPTNTFLVCASLPSANAVLLWNVRDLEPLFTLPLTALSILIPVTNTSLTDAMAASWPAYPTAAGNSGNGGATTANRRSANSIRPGEAAAAAGRRPDPRLLCLLATGSRDGGSGGGDHSNRGATQETENTGWGIFGVFCTGDDDGAGKHSCGVVTAVPLEADHAAEGGRLSSLGGCETERYDPVIEFWLSAFLSNCVVSFTIHDTQACCHASAESRNYEKKVCFF